MPRSRILMPVHLRSAKTDPVSEAICFLERNLNLSSVPFLFVSRVSLQCFSRSSSVISAIFADGYLSEYVLRAAVPSDRNNTLTRFLSATDLSRLFSSALFLSFSLATVLSTSRWKLNILPSSPRQTDHTTSSTRCLVFSEDRFSMGPGLLLLRSHLFASRLQDQYFAAPCYSQNEFANE